MTTGTHIGTDTTMKIGASAGIGTGTDYWPVLSMAARQAYYYLLPQKMGGGPWRCDLSLEAPIGSTPPPDASERRVWLSVSLRSPPNGYGGSAMSSEESVPRHAPAANLSSVENGRAHTPS
jgi:hypothetical protein